MVSNAEKLRDDLLKGRSFKVCTSAEQVRSLDRRMRNRGSVGSREQRVNTGDSGAGAFGNAVPDSGMVLPIYETMQDLSAVMSLGPETITTVGGNALPVPVVGTTEADRAPIQDLTEGGAIDVVDVEAGGPTLGAHKRGVIVPLSREIIEDAGVDIQGFVTAHLGRRMARKMDTDLITGDGNNAPQGIDNGSARASGRARFETQGVVDFKAVRGLVYNIPGGYIGSVAATAGFAAGRGGWLMHRQTLGDIFLIEGSDGHPIYKARQTMFEADMVEGYPVATTDQVPVVATEEATKANKVIYFGSFNDAMVVRMVGGVEFDLSSPLPVRQRSDRRAGDPPLRLACAGRQRGEAPHQRRRLMAYATRQQLIEWAKISGTELDIQTSIDQLLAAASSSIDRYCGRTFNLAATATRIYEVTGNRVVVDDMNGEPTEVTLLRSPRDSGGTVLDDDDWWMLPLNRDPIPDTSDNMPYTHLYLQRTAAFVEVAGPFGWPVYPPDVVLATMRQTHRWTQLPSAPLGAQASTTELAGLSVRPVDPDIRDMLGPYIRIGKRVLV